MTMLATSAVATMTSVAADPRPRTTTVIGVAARLAGVGGVLHATPSASGVAAAH